jgi:ATP-dependent Clp protease adapter protein ClpS
MSQSFSHPPERFGDAPHFRDRPRRGRTRAAPLQRCRLILHANAAVEMMSIVRTIMELTHLCRAEAMHKMWEAHHWGRSALLATFNERAELYVEQFADRGLIITMEPVDGEG